MIFPRDISYQYTTIILPWIAIWPLKRPNQPNLSFFWKSFLEIKWFGHLAFSWPYFNLEENSIFLVLFWLNFNEASNILWYFKIYLIYFGKFSLKIWPLFGIFQFFGTWQPWYYLPTKVANWHFSKLKLFAKLKWFGLFWSWKKISFKDCFGKC